MKDRGSSEAAGEGLSHRARVRRLQTARPWKSFIALMNEKGYVG